MRACRRRSSVAGRSNAPTSSIRLDHRKASIGRTQRQRQPPSTRIRASRAKVAGLHETSARRARRDAASAAACARAPARGGSTTSASKRASSAPASGVRCRSRRSVVRRAREPGAPGRLLQRREHGRIALERMYRAPGRGERQAERAAAGEQVGDAPGVTDRLVDRASDRGFGRLARLQERAGRQLDLDLAECDRRRAPLHDRLCRRRGIRAPGDAGQVVRRGERGERLAIGQARRMRRDDLQIDAACARGRLELAAGPRQVEAAEQRAKRRQQRDQLRHQHRTGIKRDHPMSGSLPKAEANRRAPAHEREPGAPAAARMPCAPAARRGCPRSPRCASAAATCWRFHAPYCARGMCCSWQPPQAPKWGHGGSARGACSSHSTGSPTRPSPR